MEKLKLLSNSKALNAIEFLKKYKNIITIFKLVILSIFTLFSLKCVELINVTLALSILFVITEFDFDGFYILFFLINFRFIFRNNLYGNIPYISIVLFVYALFCLIKYFLIKKEKIKLNWWVIGASVIYLIYLILPFHKVSFMEFMKFAIMICTINFCVLFKDKIKLNKLILCFAYGCVSGSIIFLLTQITFSNYFLKMGLDVAAYGFSRFRGLAGDPNYYSVDLILSLIGIYYLFLRKKINIAHYIILTFMFMCFAWLTYSKSILVGIFICTVLLIILTYIKDIKINWYKPVIFVVLFAMGLVTTSYVFNRNTVVLFDRFFLETNLNINNGNSGNNSGDQGGSNEGSKPEPSVPPSETQPSLPSNTLPDIYTSDSPNPDSSKYNSFQLSEFELKLNNITTGRWVLWRNHLNFSFGSFKNFMIGGGIGTYIEPMESHNTFIQILYETGFIGTCLFVGLFVLIFKDFGFNKKFFRRKHLINWLGFIACLIMFANVNYLGSTSFVYHIFVALAILFDKDYLDEEAKEIEAKEKAERNANDEKLVSVIVPIYNVEKYLDRCVESLVNQTYEKLEIILVDDGSPDGSPKLCDEWAKKDKRIKVIHKKNGGVSSARNSGLDKAKGEYVCFIDADDFVEKNYVEEMFYAAKKSDADISMCRYNKYFSEQNIVPKYEKELEKFVKNPSINYFYSGQVICTSCRNLYKAELLKDTRFFVGIGYGEDLLFLTNLFINNSSLKIELVDKYLYNYFMNENSAVQQETLKAFNRNFAYLQKSGEFLRKNGLEELAESVEYNFYITYIFKFYNIEEAKSIAENYNTKENYKAFKKCHKDFKFRLQAFLVRHKIMPAVKLIKKIKHM